jgi:OmpA-OmpF porin, OOP family
MQKYLFYILLFSFFSENTIAQSILWADRVVSFSSQSGNKIYSANQVLGKPNSLHHEESKVAWMPGRANAGLESITVNYNKSIIPKSIIVHENLNPGSIFQVIVSNGEKEWVVYENKKPVPSPKKATSTIFQVDKLKEPINKVTLVLNTAAVFGFNQIDAIGISVNRIEQYEPEINIISNLYNKKPVNMGNSINSVYDDMLPILSPDGNTLYFARKNAPENIGNKKNDDIYFSQWNPKKKQWNPAQNIGNPLNNSYHNFVVSISPDGNTLYLSGTYDENSDRKGVSYSTFKNGKWSLPKTLDIKNYYNSSKYACYHIGVDQKTMLMALERDDSYGDMDLYVSHHMGDNKWSVPINLGNTINTAGIEASVFLAADGKTIYFSSDGHAGYGGLDMFMSKRLDNSWQKWTEPINLGPQINTPLWDVYYTISASGEYAFFSSENNAMGGHDIFQIELPKELRPEPVTIVKTNITLENNDKSSTSPKEEVTKQTTTIVTADEKPTSLYKSFKGYFPLETEEVKDDKKVDKSHLKEEDDYKNINLKTGEVIYQTEADRKLFELQSKLQEIKKDQASTNTKLEKYNPYATTYTPYQESKKIDLEASKKSYNESAYISELEDKLNRLKAAKEEIAYTQYIPSTKLSTIPKKEVVLKENTEPKTEAVDDYTKKLEELKAQRDNKQLTPPPPKKYKTVEYDPEDERFKYVPKEESKPKEDILVADPEIEAYRKKLQDIKERYLNPETETETTTASIPNTIQPKEEKQKEVAKEMSTTKQKKEEKPIVEVVAIVQNPKEEKEIEKLSEQKEKLLKENEQIEQTNADLLREQKKIAEEKDKIDAEKNRIQQEKEMLDKQIRDLEIEKEKNAC